MDQPTPDRRPPALWDVELAIATAVASPSLAPRVARHLDALGSARVRAAVRARWVGPGYEAGWRALAAAAGPPLRIHCLELAAASRWSAQQG